MIKENLKFLTSLNGVPSQEDAIINHVYEFFKKYNTDVEVDRIGNVISKYKGKNSQRKIMVFAHTDELGLIVRKIDDNGFIRFERVGGVSTQILPGLVMNILAEKGNIRGVIGTPSHHFISTSQKENLPTIAEMYIDTGCTSKQQVLDLGIDVGTMIVFDYTWIENGNIVFSKAMDDRVGVAILMDLAQLLGDIEPETDVYLVAATMEEFNIRGVMPAVRKIRPDVSIGIDITPACDTPEMKYNDISLGKGPALTYMNFHGRGTLAGVLPNIQLVKSFEKIAKDNNIPIQKEVATGVITENAFILFENEGVSVANVSIPTRYTHTPFEAVHLDDVKQAVSLIHKFLISNQAAKIYGKERREK